MPCEGELRRLEPTTLFAVAPLGISEEHLGRPVDESFELIGGPEGASILPGARTFVTEVDAVEHEYIFIEDSRSLAANGGFFGISASAESERSRRHAVFSAYEIADVREIDDTVEQRDAPPNAAFFLWRIHYGHSYEALVSGEQHSFHAGVRANLGIASGSIQSFAETNDLVVRASGRGLEPRSGDAIFARTEEQIEDAYSASGDPVPIFAEYRSIPTACVTDPETFVWAEPTELEVSYDQIFVYNDGSWGADTWSLEARCFIDDREVFLEEPIIWDMRENICDDEHEGLAGPDGDGDYCEYVLGWSALLDVFEGDVVRCGIEGMAWDDSDPVEYSELRATIGDENEDLSDKIGAGNGSTEYWLFYSLRFP